MFEKGGARGPESRQILRGLRFINLPHNPLSAGTLIPGISFRKRSYANKIWAFIPAKPVKIGRVIAGPPCRLQVERGTEGERHRGRGREGAHFTVTVNAHHANEIKRLISTCIIWAGLKPQLQ